VNKSAIAGILNGAVVVAILIALASPNTSWADDHLLSVNGTTTLQNCATPQNCATVTHAGAVGTVTTPLVLINFDSNLTLTFGAGSQTLSVVSTPVKMCKPGTRINKKWPPPQDPPVYQLEWLDQGNTVVGVTGTLTSGIDSTVPINGYRLTLTMTGISDTYKDSKGLCSVSGQKTYTYTAVAVIDKQTGPDAKDFTNKLTSTYNFWNVPNSVPEPGTALLMLMGLLVLGWLGKKRLRTVGGASA